MIPPFSINFKLTTIMVFSKIATRLSEVRLEVSYQLLPSFLFLAFGVFLGPFALLLLVTFIPVESFRFLWLSFFGCIQHLLWTRFSCRLRWLLLLQLGFPGSPRGELSACRRRDLGGRLPMMSWSGILLFPARPTPIGTIVLHNEAELVQHVSSKLLR